MSNPRDDEKEFRHPSYGLVGFHRITGHIGRLFGSSLPDQHTAILLTIKPGMRRHSLSRDWYSRDHAANDGRDYIEVELSAAQFAELLTTMNCGDGVPCTVRRLNGEAIEVPPKELLEVEEVRLGFKETARKVAAKMDKLGAAMSRLFEKRTALTVADKKELDDLYAFTRQEIASNMPFIVSQFEEAAAKTVSHAKAEVDAFMTHAVVSAGIKAIADGTAPAPQLPQRKEDQ